MNSDNVQNENDLWSFGKCVFCKNPVEENFKILNCLHIICKDCTKSEKTDSGLECKCKIVTKGTLVDYLTLPSNKLFVKTCCEQNCTAISKKICFYCKSLFCKSCSKVHLIKYEKHTPLMKTYPLKKEFISCPKCMEKGVEVYCMKCSKMICPLCHLKYHQKHKFELLSKMATETKSEFNKELLEIKKNNNHLSYLMEVSDDHIQKLKTQKKKINDKIDERINMLHGEINKRSFELKRLLEKNFNDVFNNISTNKEILNDFIKENEYYYNLTSSIINHDKAFEFIKLSKIIKDQMIIARSHTNDMPKDIAKYTALVYNDEQSIKKCVEKIQGIGNIFTSPIVSLSEFKVRLNSNNVHQALENDQPFTLRSEVQPLQVKSKNEDNASIVVDLLEDSDSDSVYEPLVFCSCCNQWTEELINCTSCKRFYHNGCHIPSLAKDLKPDNPLFSNWKCTLCLDIIPYSDALYKKDITFNISIGHSERKIIERILMELYCQNNDSEHYRDCLNRKIYPWYYQKIVDPISLNNIKQRLESDESYTSLIDVLKDMKKVFTNGKLYYTSTDPYYKSADNLQISLYRMITLWIPKLDHTRLQ